MEPRAETRRDRLMRAGRWLAETREKRGMTQRRLAQVISRSPQVLSTYERGMVQVPDDVAEALAEALNVGLDETRHNLGLYASPQQVRDDEGVLRLPKGVELSPQQREALNRIVDAFIDSVRSTGS